MADLGHENDVIKYAIQRLIHFGDIPSDLIDKKKFLEILDLVKASKISDENLLKAVTAIVFTVTQVINQKDTKRSRQAKTITTVTVNNVNGLTISDELRDRIAMELEGDLRFDDILTKEIDDLTEDDFELFETTILGRVANEQTDDNNLLGLFNKALGIDYEEAEPTFQIGNQNFVKAKEAYIIDLVYNMRRSRSETEETFIRIAPKEEEKAAIAAKAALSIFNSE